MAVYKLDKLMDETRRLAAEFRQSTGNTLPVSTELAKYDAMRILDLQPPATPEKAVDAYLETPQGLRKVQIKSRVIFDPAKTGQRIGQLNMEAGWDVVVLVLMNAQYESTHIYRITRGSLEQALPELAAGKKNVRGAMSVKKFQALAELCWSTDAS